MLLNHEKNQPTPRPTARGLLPFLMSGLLLGLSCPSYPYVRLEVFAWVWMVPMLLALRSERSLPRFLSKVCLTNLVAFTVIMYWYVLATFRGFAFAVLLGVVVFAVPFAGLFLLRKAFGWRAALWGFPALWTGWEWLYYQTEVSLGAVELGHTQANLYWLVQYADVTGVWGIAFWLVLFNVLVVSAVGAWQAAREAWAGERAARKFLARRLALVTAAMLAAPLAYSAYVFTKGARADSGAGSISVLLVQPNVNAWEKLEPRARAGVLGKTVALTNGALARSDARPDLIVWPETAVPYLLSEEREAKEAVYRGVSRWQTPLLTGTLDAREAPAAPPGEGRAAAGRELYNAAVLLSPGPQVEGRRFNVESSPFYHKRVMVPFVERVPYADRFPALGRLAIDIGAGGSFSTGREATVFKLRTRRGEQVRVGAAICYEYLYPRVTADLAAGGAQAVALITNEGWFSQTHGEYQLAAFSRLRSIETRRAMARTGNTGLTWLIDPLGRVYAQAPWWSEQALGGEVALSDELSLYVRFPDYFPKACVWLSLLLFAAAIAQLVRRIIRSPRMRSAGSGAPPRVNAPGQAGDVARLGAKLRLPQTTEQRTARI